MSLAETVEFGVDRVGPAFLLEVGDGGQRHLHVGVDQLLATFADVYKRQERMMFVSLIRSL